MDANFVITKMLIFACWASSHRGKNWLTDQKIEIFKVHDIDTIIQTREKTNPTHVNSAIKIFYDHMRRLWDSGKISKLCTSFIILVAFSAENATKKVSEVQNFEILPLSHRRRMWSQYVFRAELTWVWCVFSRGWIMLSISWTLKISIFWSVNQFLPLWELAQQAKMGIFVITKLASMTIKFLKLAKK